MKKYLILLSVVLLFHSLFASAQLEISAVQKMEQFQPGGSTGHVWEAWGYYMHCGEWVAVDSRGNCTLTGSAGGLPLDIDGGPGRYALPYDASNDLFVASYSAQGAVRWGFELCGSGFDASMGIAVDHADHIWLSGMFDGRIDLDPGPDSTVFYPTGNNRDLFVAEYDSNGTFMRAMQLCIFWQGSNHGYIYGMQLDSHDNLYIAGTYEDTVDVDPGPGVNLLSMTDRPSKSFVAKYDSTMHLLDAWSFHSPNGPINILDMKIDHSDNICITGDFTHNFDFDLGPGTDILTTQNSGAFVAKYTPQGNLLWARNVNNDDQSQGDHICVTNNNGVIMAGRYAGNIFFPRITGDTTFFSWSGSFWDLDFFVSAYNDTGGIIWARNIPQSTPVGSLNELEYKSNDSTFYLAISITSPTNVDLGVTDLTLTAGSSHDMALVRYHGTDGSYMHSDLIVNPADCYNEIVVKGNKLYMSGEFEVSQDMNMGNGVPAFITTGSQPGLYLGIYCHVPENITFSVPDTVRVCPHTTFSIIAHGADRFEWYNAATGGGLLSSSDTMTIVTDIYSEAVWAEGINDNCRSTRKKIMIIVSPQLDVYPKRDTVCYGDAVSLNYTGLADVYASNYMQAFLGSQQVLQSGYIWLEATDTTLHCSLRDSSFILVNPLPAVNLAIQTDTVCLLDEPLISGGDPPGGTYSGPAVTAGVFYPSVAGFGLSPVTYSYTDSNSCSNTAASSIFVDNCLSIGSITPENISFGKNPVVSEIILEGTRLQDYSYAVYNVNGQMIKTGKYTADGIFVDGIDNGVYRLQIWNGKKSFGWSFIKISGN